MVVAVQAEQPTRESEAHAGPGKKQALLHAVLHGPRIELLICVTAGLLQERGVVLGACLEVLVQDLKGLAAAGSPQ